MVNSTKTILDKKNCLICDHTTGEVLTTINKRLSLHLFKLIEIHYSKANIVIQEKEVSQIWCHDQDVKLPHGEIGN